MFARLFVSFLYMVADEQCYACRLSPITIPSLHVHTDLCMYLVRAGAVAPDRNKWVDHRTHLWVD